MAPSTRSVTKKKKKDTGKKNTGGARARSSAKGKKRSASESDDEGDEEEQEKEKSSSDEEPVPTPKAKGKGKAKKQKTAYGDDGEKKRNKRHRHSPKTVAMSDRTFPPRPPLLNFPEIEELLCELYHPGYDEPQLLYIFNRLDKIQDDEPSNSPPRASTSNRPPPPKNDENYGIQFGFVLAAAHIIACNDRNGYLSLNPLPNPEDDLSFYYSWENTISADKIYYHIPSLSSKSTCWPVCSNFREWLFPHDDIPSAWGNMKPRRRLEDIGSKSAFSMKVKEIAANRCAVTGTTRLCGIDSAHVVPKEENPWFTRNKMKRYNSKPSNGIQDVANGFPLRKDVNASCFDAKHFVPFPRYIPDKPVQGSEFSIYFTYFHSDLYTFHRVLFLYPRALHPAFLFARFAWTILAETFVVTTDEMDHTMAVDGDSSHSTEVDKKSSEAEDDDAVDEDLTSGANNSGRGRGQGGKGKSSGRGGKGGASGGTRKGKVSYKTGQVDGAESTEGAVVLSEEIDTGGGDLDRTTLRKMYPWADEEEIEELYEEEQARTMKEDWIKKNPQVRERGDASTQVDNTDYTRIESLVNNPYQMGFYSP